MSRGRVRFECLECQTKWFPRRCEWGRAAGISCPACGSRMWIESKAARKGKKLGKGPKHAATSDANLRDARQERHVE